eukprot:1195633-Prorocentrum_minimum.AAC.9
MSPVDPAWNSSGDSSGFVAYQEAVCRQDKAHCAHVGRYNCEATASGRLFGCPGHQGSPVKPFREKAKAKLYSLNSGHLSSPVVLCATIQHQSEDPREELPAVSPESSLAGTVVGSARPAETPIMSKDPNEQAEDNKHGRWNGLFG